MKRLLVYAGFGIAMGVMVVSFLTARTYMQLIVTSAVYPAIAYLGYKLFLDTRVVTQGRKPIAVAHAIPAPAVKPYKRLVDIVDIDKRAFFKLIFGAGLSFFLFSLFAKKTEDLLFPAAASIAPGIGAGGASATDGQSMNGYRISEIDDSDITFYGFINNNGAWFIMREDPVNGTFRYTKGDADFPGAWNRRRTLPYDYYHNLF